MMKYEEYSPGDGYTYRIVWGWGNDINSFNHPSLQCIFIAEMSGRFYPFTISTHLFQHDTDLMVKAMIRELIGSESYEQAGVFMQFIKDKINDDKRTRTNVPHTVSGKVLGESTTEQASGKLDKQDRARSSDSGPIGLRLQREAGSNSGDSDKVN